MKKRIIGMALTAGILASGAAGCRSTKETTEKSDIRIETTAICNDSAGERLREIRTHGVEVRDSVKERDSVIITVRGDTVCKEVYRERLRWRVVERRDSLTFRDTVVRYRDRIIAGSTESTSLRMEKKDPGGWHAGWKIWVAVILISAMALWPLARRLRSE